MHRGGKLTEYDLDPRYRGAAPAPFAVGLNVSSSPGPLPAGGNVLALPGPAGADTSLSVEENEKRLLREALLQARGNRTKAAQLMGVSRRTLHRKLAQWPELDTVD